jgi:hypothetical protein
MRSNNQRTRVGKSERERWMNRFDGVVENITSFDRYDTDQIAKLHPKQSPTKLLERTTT